jgi:hypothetical protein
VAIGAVIHDEHLHAVSPFRSVVSPPHTQVDLRGHWILARLKQRSVKDRWLIALADVLPGPRGSAVLLYPARKRWTSPSYHERAMIVANCMRWSIGKIEARLRLDRRHDHDLTVEGLEIRCRSNDLHREARLQEAREAGRLTSTKGDILRIDGIAPPSSGTGHSSRLRFS